MTPTESMPGAQGVRWIRRLCSRMRASLTGLIDAEECDVSHIPFGAAPLGRGHGDRRVARQMRAAQVKIRKSAPPYGHSTSASEFRVVLEADTSPPGSAQA